MLKKEGNEIMYQIIDELVLAQGKNQKILVGNETGVALFWPQSYFGIKKCKIKVYDFDVYARLGSSAGTGADVYACEDIQVTHGVVGGGAWAKGNYIRGTVSGAIGRILEIVSATELRISMKIGSVDFSTEIINETTTGFVGGDTGVSATISALSTYTFTGDYKFTTDETGFIMNPDPTDSNKAYLLLRSGTGTATVEVQPTGSENSTL
jgi:hypothetical protein